MNRMKEIRDRLVAILTRQTEIKAELETLDRDAGKDPLEPERQATWDAVSKEFDALGDENDRLTTELDVLVKRHERMASLAAVPEHVERVSAPAAPRSDDPFDLSGVRAGYFDPPEQVAGELRDRVMRAMDASDVLPTEGRENVEKLLAVLRGRTRVIFMRHILATGSERYHDAFGKVITGQGMLLTDAERAAIQEGLQSERTMATGTGSTGGYAVPYDLDPTIIHTFLPGLNPIRDLCAAAGTVRTTISNQQIAITSAGLTGSYGYVAELTEAADNSPALAQVVFTPERGQAFVPFSDELDEDWGSLRSEIEMMMADAKADTEATKFLLGAGHGSNEPAGLLNATVGLQAGQTITTAGAGAFTVADLYSLLNAVPPRFRPGSAFMGGVVTAGRVRQFDTAGGSNLWAQLSADVPGVLLGRPYYENDKMATALTTGFLILVLGNFSRFRIVERLGMTIELIPNLVGTNHRPIGARGIYCRWRNTAGLVDANAFRVLKVQ